MDRGFIYIQGNLRKKDVKRYCPPFKTKGQLSTKKWKLPVE